MSWILNSIKLKGKHALRQLLNLFKIEKELLIKQNKTLFCRV